MKWKVKEVLSFSVFFSVDFISPFSHPQPPPAWWTPNALWLLHGYFFVFMCASVCVRARADECVKWIPLSSQIFWHPSGCPPEVKCFRTLCWALLWDLADCRHDVCFTQTWKSWPHAAMAKSLAAEQIFSLLLIGIEIGPWNWGQEATVAEALVSFLYLFIYIHCFFTFCLKSNFFASNISLLSDNRL